MFKLFLLLNPIYATLFWAIVLSSVKPQGNEPKTFLGKFFFVACMTFVSYVFYFLPLPEIYVYEDSIYLLTHLSIFPMYYIYVRLLTVDRKLSWRKHYIHFVTPAILIVLYLICVFCMSKEETIDFIYNKLVSNEPVTGVFLFRKIIYNLTRITFIIQGIVYMTQSILVVRKNLQNVVNFYSNTEDDSLDKVQWLNITVSVTMSTCIVMEIFGKERFTGHDFLLIGPSIVFTVMLFIIGWLGNKQRAVLLPDIEEDENDLEGKVTKSQNIHIKNIYKSCLTKTLFILIKILQFGN